MLAERMAGFSGSQTSGMRNKAKALRERGVNVINFAAGELDLPTSPAIKQAAREAIDADRTQYTDTLGIRALREKLAERVSRSTGVSYTAEEVGVTAGAKQALYNAAMVLFDPGCEVIIPAPYWVTFPVQVTLAGAVPVFLPTTKHGFQIDLTELAARITPRTRGIILNTPHNPTGAVYDQSTLEGLAGLVLKHNLTIVFDECYEQLVYAPHMHHNLVKLVPEMKSRTVLVNSFSKTYCMTGWRAGFMSAPKPIMKAVSNLQGHVTSNPSNLAQYGALAGLDSVNDAFVDNVREVLRGRRERALDLIRQIPEVRCTVPQGAFYLFPDVGPLLGRSHRGRPVKDVDALAELLLEEAHVAVVAGSAFGSDRHIRISYAVATPDVEEGLVRIRRFVEGLD
jgi:aspartate aminotransferase